MPDFLLATFVSSVKHTQAMLVERVISEGGSAENVEYLSPTVTLFLSGTPISGSVVAVETYLAHMRQVIESTATGDPKWVEVGKSFLGGYYDALEELDKETLSNNQIYLTNVTTIIASQTLEMPPLSIPLDAVEGWTLGKLSITNDT